VTSTKNLVIVVDDDDSLRESLPDMLRELGYEAMAFASGEEFLASGTVAQAHGFILDVAMPGMTGPQLKRELALRGYMLPVIFITALTDKKILSNLLKEGAVARLSKPFSQQELRAALAIAIPTS
jgi:FixJ family two-component response regulator